MADEQRPPQPSRLPYDPALTQPLAPPLTQLTQRLDPHAPHPRATGTLSRRKVLIGAGAGVAGLAALGAGAGMLLSHRDSDANGPANVFASDAEQINHLLRRAGFGPSPSTVGAYLGMGTQAATDQLINYENIPDGLDAVNAMKFDFTNRTECVTWWLLRMIYSQRPLEEKLTLFWHGVLTSGFEKVGKYPQLMVTQNNTLRANALGKFDDLIRAVSTDPAMLYWLDGRTNSGKSPNENYARELMELFTLGITNPQGQPNYTQDDVHQGALALSGWTVARDGTSAKGVFNPHRHYTGTVTYLGQTGHLGLDDVVRLVCAHPSTPYHLAWRMWSFFVYETDPTDAALQPLVDAYTHHDHSIKAMVQAMLTSPAFFSAKAYRTRLKSPTEFIVGAIRGLGLPASGKELPQVAAGSGQVVFNPPNVSGWDGDKVSGAWLSTQTWMTRVNLVNALAALATDGAGTLAAKSLLLASAGTGSSVQATIAQRGIQTPQDLVSYYVAALVDNQLADDRRAALLDALTMAPTGGASLSLAGGATVSALGVRDMLYLLMSMPEYQMN